MSYNFWIGDDVQAYFTHINTAELQANKCRTGRTVVTCNVLVNDETSSEAVKPAMLAFGGLSSDDDNDKKKPLLMSNTSELVNACMKLIFYFYFNLIILILNIIFSKLFQFSLLLFMYFNN